VKTAYLDPKLPSNLPGNPMHWAKAWFDAAYDKQVQRNPNSMTLATVGAGGIPSARVVLCKDFEPDPGYLVFYTNYRSRKAEELFNNPEVCACFHWDSIGRQIRIEGLAIRSPEEESDQYFASRDAGSRLGAWGSDQSEPLESRKKLIEQIQQRAAELGVELDADGKPAEDAAIPRPPHWGGFRIWARRVELWIDGESRIHDRAAWSRDLTMADDGTFSVGEWTGTRLQP
jgi:pyridoxamine 5'-phosphate oxidase